MSKMSVGLAGAGVFASYHAEKLIRDTRISSSGIYDLDPERAKVVADRYAIPVKPTIDDLLDDVDAVIIATPAASHFSLAEQSLRRKRHVYVEKPLSDTASDAARLIRLAEEVGCHIVAGHQERFVLHDLGFFDQNASAKSTYIVHRSSAAGGRCRDVSVTLDLMVHDLDALCYSLSGVPRLLSARGNIVDSRIESVEAILQFPDGPHVKITADRSSSAAERYIWAMAEPTFRKFDLMNRSVSTISPASNDGSPMIVETHHSRLTDPLGESVSAFIDLVIGHASPRASIAARCQSAVSAVAVATEIDRMIESSSGRRNSRDIIQ